MHTLELHQIQSFSPSNLNRDETGSPKDAVFGGVRRARISSQALKRAARMHFRDSGVLSPNELGERTKRLADEVADRLQALGRSEADAQLAARLVVSTVTQGSVETKDNKDGTDTLMTKFLLFVSEREISGLVDIVSEHWDDVLVAAKGPAEPKAADKKTSKAGDKKAGKAAVLEAKSEAGKSIGQLFQNRALLSADVAMFGRMVATDHAQSVDAAVQVAHALGTHALRERQFDFYTAVDDLKADAEPGADMIGSVEFNSAVVYRYVNVDLKKLLENLNGDATLASSAMRALLAASVYALPTGKQNTFAAHNMPSLMAAEVRPTGAPRSLANAFLRPVGQTGSVDLIAESSDRMIAEWVRQGRIFGHAGRAHVLNAHDQEIPKGKLPEGASNHESVAGMIDAVMADVDAQLQAILSAANSRARAQ